MLPNVGPMELLVILIVALVFLGPKRLPEAGKSLGKAMRDFKSALDHDDDQREPPLTESDVVESNLVEHQPPPR